MLFWGAERVFCVWMDGEIVFRKTRIIEIICNLYGIKQDVSRQKDFFSGFPFKSSFEKREKSKNDKCNLITIQIRSIAENIPLSLAQRLETIFVLFTRWLGWVNSRPYITAAVGPKRNKLDFWLKTYFICRILIVNSNSISSHNVEQKTEKNIDSGPRLEIFGK